MKINWFKINWSFVNDQATTILLYGESSDLSWLLVYLKQGKTCKDCGNRFNYCNCSWCVIEFKNKIEVRKFIINLILKNLSKIEIDRLLINFKARKFECQDYINENFNEKEINFLNHISDYLKQL